MTDLRRGFAIVAALALAACSSMPRNDPKMLVPDTATPFPTPVAETLAATGTTSSGERLRVILPAITVERSLPVAPVKVFVALVDPQGTYSYLIYPANRPGDETNRISLVEHPLEIGIGPATPYVTLWVLAYSSNGDTAARLRGWDAMATTLALSFRVWLNEGAPDDDPLAGAIRASEGALYPWFAEIDVLGQALTRLDSDGGWETGLATLAAPDGTMTVVFDVDLLSAVDATAGSDDQPQSPSPTPIARADYTLVLDETFDDPSSAGRWYQGRSRTFINEVLGGGYQIRLLGPSRENAALSWGPLGGLRVGHAAIEAEVRITEGDPDDATLGLWLRHQDDYNFLHVGLSARGEFRVSVVENNRVQRVIQDWKSHPAIRTGAASNMIAVELYPDGRHDLAVNGVHLLTFRDRTFGEGAIAFFCSARSLPATCRLENLRVWQPAS